MPTYLEPLEDFPFCSIGDGEPSWETGRLSRSVGREILQQKTLGQGEKRLCYPQRQTLVQNSNKTSYGREMHPHLVLLGALKKCFKEKKSDQLTQLVRSFTQEQHNNFLFLALAQR